jgi:hypothetical protein
MSPFKNSSRFNGWIARLISTPLLMQGALGSAVFALAGASLPIPSAAQIVVNPGLPFIGQRFFLPPTIFLPPLPAYQAEIATPGPRTSSGLNFYQTPGMTWSCQGTKCGSQGSIDFFTIETCVALAQQVGPIVSLSAAGHHARQEEIRLCNDTARGAAGPAAGTTGGTTNSTIAPPAPTVITPPPGGRIAPPPR